jgi:uncharacterized phage protein (TIGR01671 family)
MTEILFRGKRADNGEWVYGFPFAIHAGLVVEGIETLDGDRPRIDPSTVGQYTGLRERNGKRIFEWDVVVIETDCIPSFMLNRYVVVWDDDQVAYKLLKDNTIYDLPMGRMEIIGNIHDNPDLLEEKE